MKDLSKIENYAIVIDMVNGFVKYGNMHDKDIAHIVPAQIELLKKFQDEKSIIGIVKDAHNEKCAEFSSYPVHCVRGSGEEELIDELKQFETNDSLVYEKNSTSIAHVPSFFEDIKKMTNLKKVIVMGCCTDICVLDTTNPLKTFFNQNDLDIEVIVPKNVVETYEAPTHNREEYNEIAFKLMRNAGVKVVEEF
jgi:nicotinamidase-related amidase